jgi:hypothetical protein
MTVPRHDGLITRYAFTQDGPGQVATTVTVRYRDLGLPMKLRAPTGRVGVRLRPHEVALPEVRTRRLPLGRDPGVELAPGGSKALVGPMVDRPRHRRGG